MSKLVRQPEEEIPYNKMLIHDGLPDADILKAFDAVK